MFTTRTLLACMSGPQAVAVTGEILIHALSQDVAAVDRISSRTAQSR